MAKINLLTSAEREGEIISSSYKVPNTMLDIATFRPLFRDTDLRDPTLAFSFFIYISDDDLEWWPRAGMTCIGVDEVWKEQPSLGIPLGRVKGKYVQIRITIDKLREIGIELEDSALSLG